MATETRETMPPRRRTWRTGAVIAAAALLLAGAFSAAWYFRPQGGASLAPHLPEETLAWVRYAELGKVGAQPEQRAAIESFMDALRGQGFVLALLQSSFDLEVGPDATREFIAWLDSIRSVDIVLRGLESSQARIVPSLLLAVEFRRGKELQRLAKRLEGFSRTDGECAGVPVRALGPGFVGESEALVSPCYAAFGKRLVVSLNRRTLEAQLADLKAVPEHPLAANAAYLRAAQRTKRFDSRGWLGPRLLTGLADLAPEDMREKARRVLVAAGADAVRGMYGGGEVDCTAGLVGLLLDEASVLYRAFAPPSEKSGAADWIAGDAVLLVCARVGAGRQRLPHLLDYAGALGVALGEFDDPGDVRDALQAMKDDAGVDVEKIAATATEVGVFLIDGFAEEKLAFFLEFADSEAARETLAEMLGSPGMQQTEKREAMIAGVAVTVTEWETALAQLGRCLVLVPEGGEELMARIVRARAVGDTLAEDPAYLGTLGELPAKAGLRAFVRCDEFLAELRRQPGAGAMLLNLPGLVPDSLAVGLTATMADGVAEAKTLYAVTDRRRRSSPGAEPKAEPAQP